MDTITLEQLPKQDGCQHTGPLKYDKTDGPLLIHIIYLYRNLHKITTTGQAIQENIGWTQ